MRYNLFCSRFAACKCVAYFITFLIANKDTKKSKNGKEAHIRFYYMDKMICGDL